jgi:putative ABC transport system permease protein
MSMRDTWSWGWFGEVRQDVVFALRSLRRDPALVFVILVTIGLAVGLNAAAFTLFNAYVLRPIPVRDPGSLYRLRWDGRVKLDGQLSAVQYDGLQSQHGIISESFGYRWMYTRVDRQPTAAQIVTGNYFQMLGVRPAIGRLLDVSDAVPSASAVAVLSYRIWESRFARDSTVVGRSFVANGVSFEIVGVTEPAFGGLEDVPPDFWAPITLSDRLWPSVANRNRERTDRLGAIVRLRPGVSTDRARAALGAWMSASTPDGRASQRDSPLELEPRRTLTRPTPEALLRLTPVAVAFGLVMLTACANVAGAMVARGLTRRREFAVRLALGASRGRLIRQLLTESVTLALPAAVVGLLVSRFVVGGSVFAIMATVPRAYQPFVRLVALSTDGRVIIFTLLITVAATLVFGLLPALQNTRSGTVAAVRAGVDVGPSESRLRRGLVVGQIAVSSLLLICAGVLLGGSQRLQRLDLRFKSDGVLIVNVNEQFRSSILDRLRQLPEIRAIAATTQVPLEGTFPRVAVRADSTSALDWAGSAMVSSDYFRLIDLSLVSGRAFVDADERLEPKVAVVNQFLAQRLWPGRNPLGQIVEISNVSHENADDVAAEHRTVRIVGLVRDAVTGWVGEPDQAVIYLPRSVELAGMTILLRMGDTGREGFDIERQMESIDPSAVNELHTLNDSRAVTEWPFRVAFWVAGAIGVAALILTLSGVYGMLAFVVATRAKEIGVRMAVGASGARVMGLVLRQTVRLAVAGVLLGLTLALAMTRVASSALVMIDMFQPIAYLGGLGVVLLACFVGAALPTLRASRIDSVAALRGD